VNYSSPESKAFCIRLRALIKRLGPDAFGTYEKGVLYSGPDRLVKDHLKIPVSDNVKRSVPQANQFHAIRIDATRIGRLLDRFDLDRYFRNIFDFDGSDNLIEAAIFDAWACASREFVRSSFKHASTAVCGGSRKRVFRKHELKVIVTQRTKVESINGVLVQKLKDIYKKYKKPSDGFYAVFVEICRAELDLFRNLAITAPPDKKDEAWEEHDARKLFFDLEQSLTVKKSIKKALASMTVHRAAIAGSSKRAAHRASPKVALKH